MLYSSSSISIRFSIGIPCTIAASSSVSPEKQDSQGSAYRFHQDRCGIHIDAQYFTNCHILIEFTHPANLLFSSVGSFLPLYQLYQYNTFPFIWQPVGPFFFRSALFFPVPEVVVYLLLEFVSTYCFPSIYAGLRVFKFPFCTPFGTLSILSF